VNKTIMVVDDSASIRQMVSFTIKNCGYDVVEAKDGQDALAKMNNGTTVNMIITDLNMPNLDGIGLIRNVRRLATHKFIPIIMLTTESQESKKLEGKQAGATGWIIKPFKPDQLVSVIKKVLG
jgi:two-component system, chemotaxis family, chemotaxis protein CheY